MGGSSPKDLCDQSHVTVVIGDLQIKLVVYLPTYDWTLITIKSSINKVQKSLKSGESTLDIGYRYGVLR